MIYKDGKQIKELFRHKLKLNGYTMTECAAAAGMTRQALNNRFLRQDISLTEISRLAACCGLSVYVDFIPAADRKPGSNATSATS